MILKKIGVISDGLIAIIAGNLLFVLLGSTLIPQSWINSNNLWNSVLVLFFQIGIRLGLVLLLGIIVWKLRSKQPLSEAGFSFNNYSLLRLVGIGILMFCFASLPWKTIVFVNQLFPFGEGLHGWDYLNSVSLSPAVVTYILVSAMLLPPILEELYCPGYLVKPNQERIWANWCNYDYWFYFSFIPWPFL